MNKFAVSNESTSVLGFMSHACGKSSDGTGSSGGIGFGAGTDTGSGTGTGTGIGFGAGIGGGGGTGAAMGTDMPDAGKIRPKNTTEST